MQTATAAFGTVVTSNDVVTALRVLITFPSGVTYSDASLTVSDVTIDRQLSTDMPAGTRLVSGYPSAQLSMTLAGTLDPADETKSITWLMGHYQTTSPLYRRDCKNILITVDAGVLDGASGTSPPFEGVEFLRNFTGYIDDYTVDREAGTVTLTALDGRTKLSTAPQLPSAFGPTSAFPWMLAPTSEWALDALIHPTYLTRPAQRDGCVLAASMRSTIYPNIGQIDPTSSPTFGQFAVPIQTITGVFGTAIKWAHHIVYDFTTPLSPSGFFFEAWLGTGSNTNNIAGNVRLDFKENLVDPTNTVSLRINRPSQLVQVVIGNGVSIDTYTFASPPTFGDALYYVGFSIVGTTLQIAFQTGLQSFTITTPSAAVSFNNLYIFDATFIEAVQVAPASGTPTFNGSFAPTAVLDPSLNVLTAIPDTGGQDTWSVIQQIADAEQGVAGLDESGTFRFRNRATLAKAASVRTITSTESLSTLNVETSMAAYANHVTVPVNSLIVGTSTWVWTPTDPPLVPAKGSWVQTITPDHPVVALALTDSGVCPASQQPDGKTYWRGCKAIDGAGAQVSAGIHVTCVQLSSSSITVTVTNANAFPVYLVTPIGVGYPAASQGQPALMIGGIFVTPTADAGDSTTTVSGAVSADAQWPPLVPDGGAAKNPLGEHLLAVSDNPWRQDLDGANRLALDLRDDLCTRRPLWTNVKIMHDPRLQLGDRVTLSDPDVTGMSAEDAFIYSINLGADWTATLDLRPIGAPGGWLLNQAGRSELNSTIYI